MIRITACVALLLAATGASAQSERTTPEPANEGFRLCNRTGQPVEVAKALYTGKSGGSPGDFISEGWYQFADGDCFVLWPGKLQYRYYLIYAQNKQNGREWAGDIPVCVSREPFTIRTKSCGADNYRRMFFQVDTGDQESWTHSLTP